jgi:RNA polymerase sigma factor (sigma-70 family)
MPSAGNRSMMAASEAGQLAARAVDHLYRSHGSDVYRYAFAVLGNHADAEDVTQTTFLNAYRSLEQGLRPRKPSNWLLTIATNVVKQRFRSDGARPREVPLDEQVAGASEEAAAEPTVGEVLGALSRIPPQQRQAIVLRELEGRSYKEVAQILGVTTSALEALLFRARRSLAEELENELTCTEAQLAISRLADGRIGRKERRRLRTHLAGCPDCSRFARVQQRHRRAIRGLMLLPVPVSLSLFRELDGTATAATTPALGGGAVVVAGASATGTVATGAAGGGLFAGGVAVKAAAVVTAASVAGGVGVVGAAEVDRPDERNPRVRVEGPGERLGREAPRGVVVPGRGVAVGKREGAARPGQRVGQTERGGERETRRGRRVGQADRDGGLQTPRGRAVGRGERPAAEPSTRARRVGQEQRELPRSNDSRPVARDAPARGRSREARGEDRPPPNANEQRSSGRVQPPLGPRSTQTPRVERPDPEASGGRGKGH